MRTVEVTDALQEYLNSLVPPRDRVLARMEGERTARTSRSSASTRARS